MGHHLRDALGGDVREQRLLAEVVDQPLERPPGRLGRAVELADLGPVARDDMAHGRRLLAAPGGPARLLGVSFARASSFSRRSAAWAERRSVSPVGKRNRWPSMRKSHW